MAHIYVYYPKSVRVMRKWIEKIKQKHGNNPDEYLIINEDGKSCDLDEYLQPLNGVDITNSRISGVYFIYPENGKTVDEINKFVDFVVDISQYRWVDIYTVSDWILAYLNVYIYIGEMTASERDVISEKFGINKYIRFKDIHAEWLDYDDSKNIFTFESIPSFGSPPEFEFIYEEQASELNRLFIKLQMIYEDYRRE